VEVVFEKKKREGDAVRGEGGGKGGIGERHAGDCGFDWQLRGKGKVEILKQGGKKDHFSDGRNEHPA